MKTSKKAWSIYIMVGKLNLVCTKNMGFHKQPSHDGLNSILIKTKLSIADCKRKTCKFTASCVLFLSFSILLDTTSSNLNGSVLEAK